MGYELTHRSSTDFSLISKYICQTFNLNQLQFSKQLGSSTASVNRLIHGKAKPNKGLVQRLTQLFLVAVNHNLQQRGMRNRRDLSQMDLAAELKQLGLDPQLVADLRAEFQHDISTTEGADFWLSAALIGFSYLMLNTEQLSVPDTLSSFNIDPQSWIQVQFLPRWIGHQAIRLWSATQRQNSQPKLTADQIAANQLSPIDNHPSNSETRIDNEPK